MHIYIFLNTYISKYINTTWTSWIMVLYVYIKTMRNFFANRCALPKNHCFFFSQHSLVTWMIWHWVSRKKWKWIDFCHILTACLVCLEFWKMLIDDENIIVCLYFPKVFYQTNFHIGWNVLIIIEHCFQISYLWKYLPIYKGWDNGHGNKYIMVV